jgi:hypothetical protein
MSPRPIADRHRPARGGGVACDHGGLYGRGALCLNEDRYQRKFDEIPCPWSNRPNWAVADGTGTIPHVVTASAPGAFEVREGLRIEIGDPTRPVDLI